MEENASRRKRLSRLPRQTGFTFAAQDQKLDPKTRSEVVALLGLLLLEVAQRSVESEARDDAS